MPAVQVAVPARTAPAAADLDSPGAGTHPVGGPPGLPADLPARVRVPPYRAVLPVAAGARLIGLDPTVAVLVEGLPEPLAELLDGLTSPTQSHVFVARATERGVPGAEALLRDLLDVGALVDAAAAERRQRHRAACTAVVTGCGALAVGVVTGLLQAGVGAVHIDTAGTVRGVDLGTGYVDADRGRRRVDATRDAVRRLLPAAGTGPPPLRLVPDLVVLADEAPEPGRIADLLADGIAHLPVVLRDGIGIVGPLVLPGRSACLSCVHLHRQAHDPAWSAVAARLVGRSGRADPACVTATAGLAAAQALAALDGSGTTHGRHGYGEGPPPTLDATLELDVAAGTLVRRTWTPLPECHCRAARGEAHHGRATSGERWNGDTIMG